MTPFQARARFYALTLVRAWRFAKTAAKTNPHHYTLRKGWADDASFDEAVRLIRAAGRRELFWRKPYTVFDLNGWKYWTMGAPVDETILINRAVLPYREPYDALAARYDDLWTTSEARAEDETVLDAMSEVFRRILRPTRGSGPREIPGRWLDIGCGTGQLLDYLAPDNYVGVDDSTHMLATLAGKYAERPGVTVARSKFEHFYGGTFDAAVALYGAASYIDPDALLDVPKMLNPGGRFFLMFYAPGYHPRTYERTGVEVSHYPPERIPNMGARFRLGNYVVVAGEAV